MLEVRLKREISKHQVAYSDTLVTATYLVVTGL